MWMRKLWMSGAVRIRNRNYTSGKEKVDFHRQRDSAEKRTGQRKDCL